MTGKPLEAHRGHQRREPGAAMGRLSVALDVLPLSGELTGVGRFCAGLGSALAVRSDLELHTYAIARHTRSASVSAAKALGSSTHTWPVPTSVVNKLWARFDVPPIEWLVGHVDVVHGTNYVVPPSSGAGRVVAVHDLTAMRYPELCARASLAYPKLVARAIDKGAFVHVPTHFVRDEVLELLGASPERVRVIHYGLEVPGDPSTPLPSPEGTSRAGAPYVLALGAVEPRKDLPSLVSAFAELARSHDDLELVVAGPKGWGESAFWAAVESCGIAQRVRRVGYLADDERQALLAGAVVLAYPSLYEGFGFPPLEAMAAGVPVVTTAAGGIPEIVGDAALVVPPGDAGALAGALGQVVGDAQTRSRLVELGRARAASFTWESCAAEMVELYELAAADRQAR